METLTAQLIQIYAETEQVIQDLKSCKAEGEDEAIKNRILLDLIVVKNHLSLIQRHVNV